MKKLLFAPYIALMIATFAFGSNLTMNPFPGVTLNDIAISEYIAGNSGTAKTIDWLNGNAQKVTLTGNVTFTLSNPKTGAAYLLRLATGSGGFTASWPGTVLWSGGTAPTITTTASKVDLINLYWDGTSYYGSFLQNY